MFKFFHDIELLLKSAESCCFSLVFFDGDQITMWILAQFNSKNGIKNTVRYSLPQVSLKSCTRWDKNSFFNVQFPLLTYKAKHSNI